MTSPLSFEEFDRPQTQARTVFLPGNRLKTLRAQAWQQGFEEGERQARERAGAAQEKALCALTDVLEQCAFTHVEATHDVLTSLKPMIEAMIRVVLPEIAAASLGQTVRNEVLALAERAMSDRITVTCPPDLVPVLRQLLAETGASGDPPGVVGDPDCPALSAHISVGEAGTSIELDRAMQEIAMAVEDFFGPRKETQTHD